MCGRFALYSLSRELERRFDALPPGFDIPPSYNIAPAQEIPVVLQLQKDRHFQKRRWGLVPFWAKDPSIGAGMINARVETLSSKPAFKAAAKHRRCLVPANGFYEWAGRSGSKQPYYFRLPSGEPFAFAGLYETWQDRKATPEAGPPYESCTIITMEATDSVREIHNRMPLILKPEAYAQWLDPANREPAGIEELLKTHCVKELVRHPVSRRVNRVEMNSRECIEPFRDAGQ